MGLYPYKKHPPPFQVSGIIENHVVLKPVLGGGRRGGAGHMLPSTLLCCYLKSPTEIQDSSLCSLFPRVMERMHCRL